MSSVNNFHFEFGFGLCFDVIYSKSFNNLLLYDPEPFVLQRSFHSCQNIWSRLYQRQRDKQRHDYVHVQTWNDTKLIAISTFLLPLAESMIACTSCGSNENVHRWGRRNFPHLPIIFGDRRYVKWPNGKTTQFSRTFAKLARKWFTSSVPNGGKSLSSLVLMNAASSAHGYVVLFFLKQSKIFWLSLNT